MKYAAAFATILPLVAAHGFVQSPPPRKPGDAYKAACGEQPFNQQSADINGNVQGIFQVVGSDLDASKCNLWLCKGFLLEDNPDNLQTFSLGEKIDFDVTIAAPHTGYANVSVVKTSSNSIIGSPLIEFDNYASNAGVAANNSAFSVTLPESLGGDCTEAGDCVLQWFWDAPDIDQTYESCVDFVVGGSGSGSGSGSGNAGSSASASAPAASEPAATEPAATSVQAAATTSLGPVFSEVPTQATEAPAATATTGAGDDAADDEDCDEEDDGEVIDDGEDEECPADDEEDVDDGSADDEEECPADEDSDLPADEYEDDSTSTPTQGSSGPSAAANNETVPKPTAGSSSSGSSSSNGSGSKDSGSASTVTSYVTVAAETKYVTVTADAPACTA